MRRLADCLDRRHQLTELGVDENGYPIAFSEPTWPTDWPAINFRM